MATWLKSPSSGRYKGLSSMRNGSRSVTVKAGDIGLEIDIPLDLPNTAFDHWQQAGAYWNEHDKTIYLVFEYDEEIIEESEGFDDYAGVYMISVTIARADLKVALDGSGYCTFQPKVKLGFIQDAEARKVMRLPRDKIVNYMKGKSR